MIRRAKRRTKLHTTLQKSGGRSRTNDKNIESVLFLAFHVDLRLIVLQNGSLFHAGHRAGVRAAHIGFRPGVTDCKRFTGDGALTTDGKLQFDAARYFIECLARDRNIIAGYLAFHSNIEISEVENNYFLVGGSRRRDRSEKGLTRSTVFGSVVTTQERSAVECFIFFAGCGGKDGEDE